MLLLLAGQRVNTIFWYHIDEMVINDISITFAPSHVLKHSRKNRKQDVFEYRHYPNEPKLCIVNCLKEYLTRRQSRVSDSSKKLLLTYKKPYKEASVDTIRRWVKSTFKAAGIYDFSAHSCRAASTSKAKSLNIDVEHILAKGCWTNVKTFRKFYDKEIICEAKEEEFNKLLN